MSISRRQFILGAGAGFILPAYYDKVFTFFENHGEPLIEVPKAADIDLVATIGYDQGLQLHLGNPHQEPPELTVREFAERYYSGLDECLGTYELEGTDPESLMDSWDVFETWVYQDSSSPQAYRLLKGMDLGPDLDGGDAVGEIRFIDGACPGNNSFWSEAEDEVSLSLLQKRLNELNTGIRVSLGGGW